MEQINIRLYHQIDRLAFYSTAVHDSSFFSDTQKPAKNGITIIVYAYIILLLRSAIDLGETRNMDIIKSDSCNISHFVAINIYYFEKR